MCLVLPRTLIHSTRMLKDDVIVEYRQLVGPLTFTPHFVRRPFQYASRVLYRRNPGGHGYSSNCTALTVFAGLRTHASSFEPLVVFALRAIVSVSLSLSELNVAVICYIRFIHNVTALHSRGLLSCAIMVSTIVENAV
jgi:hypothetical protein